MIAGRWVLGQCPWMEQVLLKLRKLVSIFHSLNFRLKVQRWALESRRRDKVGVEVWFHSVVLHHLALAARFLTGGDKDIRDGHKAVVLQGMLWCCFKISTVRTKLCAWNGLILATLTPSWWIERGKRDRKGRCVGFSWKDLTKWVRQVCKTHLRAYVDHFLLSALKRVRRGQGRNVTWWKVLYIKNHKRNLKCRFWIIDWFTKLWICKTGGAKSLITTEHV